MLFATVKIAKEKYFYSDVDSSPQYAVQARRTRLFPLAYRLKNRA